MRQPCRFCAIAPNAGLPIVLFPEWIPNPTFLDSLVILLESARSPPPGDLLLVSSDNNDDDPVLQCSTPLAPPTTRRHPVAAVAAPPPHCYRQSSRRPPDHIYSDQSSLLPPRQTRTLTSIPRFATTAPINPPSGEAAVPPSSPRTARPTPRHHR
jgi:hypothetical protein